MFTQDICSGALSVTSLVVFCRVPAQLGPSEGAGTGSDDYNRQLAKPVLPKFSKKKSGGYVRVNSEMLRTVESVRKIPELLEVHDYPERIRNSGCRCGSVLDLEALHEMPLYAWSQREYSSFQIYDAVSQYNSGTWHVQAKARGNTNDHQIHKSHFYDSSWYLLDRYYVFGARPSSAPVSGNMTSKVGHRNIWASFVRLTCLKNTNFLLTHSRFNSSNSTTRVVGGIDILIARVLQIKLLMQTRRGNRGVRFVKCKERLQFRAKLEPSKEDSRKKLLFEAVDRKRYQKQFAHSDVNIEYRSKIWKVDWHTAVKQT
ncbi:hypothetical protein F5876DRAFT_65775 [Lentinula aff. lateritia]|uniref:Uncharacterized protein n=1 Tax=Lentinula aff. lateritia TaxID=2804960 RepID=A0ACC1U104_9AGAR|nr:hypothetical protein F5876DRAFT_65775 [Lentinula aff. lateritia]